MSILPYRKPTRPQRTLDQPRILRAALELLDEAGLDELSMRRLADHLGVKAASLYRHLRDKDELLVLLADEIAAEIPPLRPTGRWRRDLLNTACNVRRGLHLHRDAARLLAITPPFGPNRLRHIDSTLRILQTAGITGRTAVRAAYHLNNFVTEFVADEARMSAFASTLPAGRKKMFSEARKYFRSLPAAEYPAVVKLADSLSEDDPDGLFRFGLEIWLTGIEKLSRRRG